MIAPSAVVKGPAIIGVGCEIRHAAYLRQNVILGNGCVVSNSTEIKNAILFNEVQAPRFNYVGDSVFGHRSHLGAAAVLSNVRLDGDEDPRQGRRRPANRDGAAEVRRSGR